MVGSALIELCGSVIFGLTRSVAEHYDPNCVEFDPGTFGFHRLESTGLEWNSHPVDELTTSFIVGNLFCIVIAS